MNEPFNPKTPVDYLLGKLSEECGEIIQAIEKVRTFGFSSLERRSGRNNFERLQLEILDFRGTLTQLNAELDKDGLPMFTVNHHSTIIAKMAKIRHYSEYSIEMGLLASPLQLVDPNVTVTFERVLNP